MRLVFYSTFFFLLLIASTWSCKDMTGDWVNEKDSNLTVIQSTRGTVTGWFTTAVESHPGASGGSQPILGLAYPDIELISFAVMFNTSTVVYTGQCYTLPNGQDILWTSWILKSNSDMCEHNWMTNTVGEDRFTRIGSPRNNPNGPCGK